MYLLEGISEREKLGWNLLSMEHFKTFKLQDPRHRFSHRTLSPSAAFLTNAGANKPPPKLEDTRKNQRITKYQLQKNYKVL